MTNTAESLFPTGRIADRDGVIHKIDFVRYYCQNAVLMARVYCEDGVLIVTRVE